MFPPAALAFDQALRTSAALPATLRRPHMVNADMVVKREHLPRMDDITLKDAGFERDRPVHVALVGVPLSEGQAAVDALAVLTHPRRKIRCRPVSLEVTTEAPLGRGDAGTAEQIDALAEACHAADVTLYIEPRWPEPLWPDRIDEAAAGLAAATHPVGLKARCAGPTALGPATLARVVNAVAREQIPLKATQGLHHPVVERARYGNNVGFLGLALALRLALRASTPELQACIATDDAQTLRFTSDTVHWGGHSLTRDELQKAQHDLPFQIGSCSLDEPDDDLVRLYG